MSGALALVVEPTGNFTLLRLPGGHNGGDLEAMQKLVGGYIEAVSDEDFGLLYLNEEGKMMSLPINLVCTAILDSYIPGFSRQDVLVGNVVWLDSNKQGDSADVRPDTLSFIVTRIVDARRSWVRITHAGNTQVITDGRAARDEVMALAEESMHDAGFGEIKVEVTP